MTNVQFDSLSNTVNPTYTTFNLKNIGYLDLSVSAVTLEAGASAEITVCMQTLYSITMPSFSDSFC